MHRRTVPLTLPLQPNYGDAPIRGQRNYKGEDLLIAAQQDGWTYSPWVFIRFIDKVAFHYYPDARVKIEYTGALPTHAQLLNIAYKLIMEDDPHLWSSPNPFSKEGRETVLKVGVIDNPDDAPRHGNLSAFFDKFKHDIETVKRFEQAHRIDHFPFVLDEVEMENAINLYDELFRVMTAHLVNEIWEAFAEEEQEQEQDQDEKKQKTKQYIQFFAQSYLQHVLLEVRAQRKLDAENLALMTKLHEMVLNACFNRYHKLAFSLFCTLIEFELLEIDGSDYRNVQRLLFLAGGAAKRCYYERLKLAFTTSMASVMPRLDEKYNYFYLRKVSHGLALLAPLATDAPATQEIPFLQNALKFILSAAAAVRLPKKFIKDIKLRSRLRKIPEKYREQCLSGWSQDYNPELFALIREAVWPESKGIFRYFNGRKQRMAAMEEFPVSSAEGAPLSTSSLSHVSETSSVGSLSEAAVSSARLSTESSATLSGLSTVSWVSTQLSCAERNDSGTTKDTFYSAAAAAAAIPVSSSSVVIPQATVVTPSYVPSAAFYQPAIAQAALVPDARNERLQR